MLAKRITVLAFAAFVVFAAPLAFPGQSHLFVDFHDPAEQVASN